MARYLLLGDLHLSDRPPSACTDTYLDDLFDLLAATVTLARAQDVAAVIWAGDVFHHKTPGRTSHATVRRLIDLVATYPCPVYVVAGNHDLSHDRIASLDEGQPLGVMLAAGAVRALSGWSDRHGGDGLPDPVYGVPWQVQFDDDLVSQALHDWRDRLGLPRPPRSRAKLPPALVVAHAPLYPPGQELAFEFYPTARWAAAMGGHGSVYYGHVHEPHGVYTVDGVTFANPGALSRGSLHEHNLTREIQVTTWDAASAATATGGFTLHTLPHKGAEQVFRLAETGAERSAQLDLDTFLAGVGQAAIEITSIEAVLHHLRSVDPPLGPDLLALAEELLIGAST